MLIRELSRKTEAALAVSLAQTEVQGGRQNLGVIAKRRQGLKRGGLGMGS